MQLMQGNLHALIPAFVLVSEIHFVGLDGFSDEILLGDESIKLIVLVG